MKNTYRLILVLLTVLLCPVFLYGQEKALEKSMFISIIDQSLKDLEGKTFRRINTFETFDAPNTAPVKTLKSTFERTAPDRFRWSGELNGQKVERIQIGEKNYYRENGGKWTEKKPDSGLTIGEGCGSIVEFQSYKVYRNISLEGKTANLYEMTQKLNFIGCDIRAAGSSNLMLSTKRFWISEDGSLLQTEYIDEDVEKKSRKREVSVYEYDAGIKIEAPVK